MSNLALRLLSAAVLIPLVLVLIFFGSHFIFSVIIVLLAALSGFEYGTITLGRGSYAHLTILSVLSGIFAASLAFSPAFPWAPVLALSILPFVSLLAFMFRQEDYIVSFRAAAFTVFGVLYTGVLFGFIALLFVTHQDGPLWVFTLFLGSVLSDTGAYAIGRIFGRRKLAPRLSPGKTRAGAIGGLLLTLLGIVVMKLFFFVSLSWPIVFLLSFFLSISCQFGDLSESFLKRSFGVKDSGKLIPGHGGLLDRVDGLIFGAPVVFFFSMLN